MRLFGWFLGLCLATPLAADPVTTQAEVRLLFTPGNDAAGEIIAGIDAARHQVLVQAYVITHRDIARSLLRARQRGLDIEVVADAEQAARTEHSRLPELVRGGIGVFLDAEHAAAHNKLILIDVDTPDAVVFTGSFNFTTSAQFRNAENLLRLRNAPALFEAYRENWRRHRLHATPFR